MTEDARLLLARIDALEAKLDSCITLLSQGGRAAGQESWIDSAELCQLLSVSRRHLFDLVVQGVIHGDAIRNVGTQRRPRYRFHRQKAYRQYISRN